MPEKNLGELYIVATPIGNLQDITLRAVEILGKIDWLLAEDTRITTRLLRRYNVKVNLKTFHEHSDEQKFSWVLERLQAGDKLALVSDAGTPGICDPGGKLVAFVRENLPETKIIPLPGASALTAVLSVAGISANQFVFLGYPPHKKGRQTFFKKIGCWEIRPIVFYESCYRFQKALDSLEENLIPEQKIFIGREVTKIYEEFFFGKIVEAKKYFTREKLKGEFVIVVE